MKAKKLILCILALPFLLCSMLSKDISADDCVFPTVTGDVNGLFPKLMLITRVDGAGDYTVVGGSPPFELWARGVNPDTDWSYKRTVEKDFFDECSNACSSNFDMKIIDIRGNESNIHEVRGGDEFKFEDSNQEVGPGGSLVLGISGGVPPYDWSVQGNGFWLEESQSQGLSNTLYADNTACGSAMVGITDACNVTVTGSIRCTQGIWRQHGYHALDVGNAENTGPCDWTSPKVVILDGRWRYTFDNDPVYYCRCIDPDALGYHGPSGDYPADPSNPDPYHSEGCTDIPCGTYDPGWRGTCWRMGVYIEEWTCSSP